MSWVSLILAGIQLAGKMTDFLAARQAITAADSEHVKAILAAAKDKSDEITKSMDDAAKSATANGMPDKPDPFQRD